MKKINYWRFFYPLLFGLYPVVELINVNISQMILLAGLRSLLVAIIFTFTTYAILLWRIRDKNKAAFLSAWIFLFFFFYGHFYDATKDLHLFGLLIGRHLVLFPFWLLVFGIGVWLIFARVKNLQSVGRTLNIVSVILLIIPVFQIVMFEWKRNHPISYLAPENLVIQTAGITETKQLPDVYYIILDGYARDDMLLKDYQLDISSFIQELENVGFYVPRCSLSNYGETALSLSSSLNMNTLDQIVPQTFKRGSSDSMNDFFNELSSHIKHSLVRQIFEGMGYKTVSFQNDLWWTEWSDANYFITDNSRPYEFVTNFNKITSFEVLFLRTTILRFFEEASTKWLAPITKQVVTPEKEHAELVLLALNELANVPQSIPSPKFIFAHIISPHYPYVFSPDGDFIITTETDPGYPNQIQYLNKQVLLLVQRIIKKSTIPPIIILQADHGRDREVRNANFMAIYFPSGGTSVLYPTLTPVNIFRLVFNTYFGQNFPILPDKSYSSPEYTSFNFSEVTYPCNQSR